MPGEHGVDEPQALVEAALGASGADGCVVIVADHSETNLRWAANNLTTNGQMRSRSVTVVSTVDGAAGTSCGVLSRSVANLDELQALVAAADAAARAADPAEDAAPLVENYPHEDDWAAEPLATGVDVFEAFAESLGATFAQWRTGDRLLFGFAEHQLTSTFLGTSTGLRRRHDQPDGRIELNAKTGDYASSAYANAHTPSFAEVDPAALADDLARRLDWAATRVELPAGRYETILPPSPVADLMTYAYWTASARDAEEGRSAFSRTGGSAGGSDGSAGGAGGSAGSGAATKIGSVLSSLPARLYSDPAHPEIGCAPFLVAPRSSAGMISVFDNGMPTPAADWTSDGRLTSLIANRAWARRSEIPTAPFVDNLILDAGGTASIEDMVAATERGLLLTTLWYIRMVDPQTLLTTGLTRDGVYLIENGRITGAVNNFRFNESPLGVLARATEAGRTVHAMSREWGDWFRRSAMPPLRVPDFNMSTVSDAN